MDGWLSWVISLLRAPSDFGANKAQSQVKSVPHKQWGSPQLLYWDAGQEEHALEKPSRQGMFWIREASKKMFLRLDPI